MIFVDGSKYKERRRRIRLEGDCGTNTLFSDQSVNAKPAAQSPYLPDSRFSEDRDTKPFMTIHTGS